MKNNSQSKTVEYDEDKKIVTTYGKNGTIKRIEKFYKNGELESVENYYDQGVLSMKTSYNLDGTLDIIESFDIDGWKSDTRKYKNGKIDCEEFFDSDGNLREKEVYFPLNEKKKYVYKANGELKSIYNFKADKVLSIDYYKLGSAVPQIESRRFCEYDRNERPTFVRDVDANGNQFQTIQYVYESSNNDNKYAQYDKAIETHFYENGEKSSEKIYDNDENPLISKMFYENGNNKRIERYYENGAINNVQEYDKSGALEKVAFYDRNGENNRINLYTDGALKVSVFDAKNDLAQKGELYLSREGQDENQEVYEKLEKMTKLDKETEKLLKKNIDKNNDVQVYACKNVLEVTYDEKGDRKFERALDEVGRKVYEKQIDGKRVMLTEFYQNGNVKSIEKRNQFSGYFGKTLYHLDGTKDTETHQYESGEKSVTKFKKGAKYEVQYDIADNVVKETKIIIKKSSDKSKPDEEVKQSEIEYYPNGMRQSVINYQENGQKSNETWYGKNGIQKFVDYNKNGQKNIEKRYGKDGRVVAIDNYDKNGQLIMETEYDSRGNVKHSKEYDATKHSSNFDKS